MHRIAERIERYPWITLGMIGFLYFLGFGAIAYSVPLTSDEVFSITIARLPSVHVIFQALTAGADTNPPLQYLVLRAAHHFLGPSVLAGRLPFLTAVWLTSLFITAFVARRTSFVYGVFAGLIPFMTQFSDIAHLTRHYALLFLAYGCALWLWQQTLDKPRGWESAALALTVGAAVWTHLYGVLVILPIAVGELWRTKERRDWNPWVWIALLCGLLPEIFLRDQIRNLQQSIGRAVFHSPQSLTTPVIQKLLSSYTDSFQPAMLLVLLGFLIASLLTKKKESSERTSMSGLRPPEMAAALTLLALPVVEYFIGYKFTDSYGTTYAYMASIGAAFLAAHAAFIIFEGRRRHGMVLAGCLFVGFGVFQYRHAQFWRYPPSETTPEIETFLRSTAQPTTLPIVVAYIIPFMQSEYYAGASLRPRLAYLTDEKKSARFGDPLSDTVIRNFRPWSDFHIEEYESFIKTHPVFLLYDCHGLPGWLEPYLLEIHAQVNVLAVSSSSKLLNVKIPTK